MILKRIEPLSCAKVYGIICVFIGLIAGLLVAGVTTVARQIFGPGPGSDAFQDGLGYMIGPGAILSYPIFYGILGFVSGFLGALLYNWIAKHIGGIEVEFE